MLEEDNSVSPLKIESDLDSNKEVGSFKATARNPVFQPDSPLVKFTTRAKANL